MDGKKMHTNETKSERFERLATRRVNKVLEQIRIIGNLASQPYEFTPEQVERIVVAIQGAILEMEEKFQKPLGRKSKKFQF
jgi:hypothetical protein